jgi:tetratricopeptide (TPR) repeat protein
MGATDDPSAGAGATGGDDRVDSLVADDVAGAEPWVRENLRIVSAIESFDGDDEAPPLPLPSALGPYELLERIGAGGMGDVYRARQTRPLAREVAVKVLRGGLDSRRVLARFENERQTLASLDDDGIARVLDAGESESGRPYFVMELVRGVPITAYCELHRLDVPGRLSLFGEVCRAVHAAHQRGVIHRDLKPSNLLVTAAGGRAVPKIIDFGVAKAAAASGHEGRARATEAGQILGTPEYMSPEQIDAPESVDVRADVYSLGAVLYELLTGAMPFDSRELRSGGLARLVEVIRERTPPLPSARVDDAPRRRRLRGDLDRIAMRALEKDRARRYGSASELAADLARHLRHEPVAAGPPGAAYRAGKFVRRHRTLAAAAGALLVALAAGVVATGLEAERARRAEARALESAEAARAVNRFLAGMLAEANPETNPRGGALTMAEALDLAASRLEGAFGGQPLVEAEIRRTLGVAYDALGRGDVAAKHLGRAVELTRAHGSAAERIEALDVLVTAELRAERMERAEAAAREAVRVAADSLPPAHDAARRARMGLARTLTRRGAYADADSLVRGVLALGRDASDSTGAVYARRLHEYGALLKYSERLEEAEAAFREALGVLGAALGEDHPDVLRAKVNLADLLRTLGRFDDAESLLVEALSSTRRVLGDVHPDVGNALMVLGATRLDAGRFPEAEATLREAVAVSRAACGEEHPNVASALGYFGDALQKQGKSREALPVFREALAIQVAAHGEEHQETAGAQNNLASVLRSVGDHAEAARLLRRARETEARLVGPESMRIALITHNLARTLGDGGELEPADAEFRKAIEAAVRTYPAGHPMIDIFRSNHGELLLRMGRVAQAETLLAASSSALAKALGEEHPRTVQAAEWLREARRRAAGSAAR